MVTESVPGLKFGFRVGVRPIKIATLTYDIASAEDGGCTVTESNRLTPEIGGGRIGRRRSGPRRRFCFPTSNHRPSLARSLGDLAGHNEILRRKLKRHGGSEIKSQGEGPCSRSKAPARRAAASIAGLPRSRSRNRRRLRTSNQRRRRLVLTQLQIKSSADPRAQLRLVAPAQWGSACCAGGASCPSSTDRERHRVRAPPP